ncbi:hypothetical protein LCGC14_0993370 [marine sediment metagenome]|uniref:Uncharacterized protein n=1 Tax=marine sediment metagenome TaxID=412755 RepID=A0A0F9RBJ0_9ZZZZ
MRLKVLLLAATIIAVGIVGSLFTTSGDVDFSNRVYAATIPVGGSAVWMEYARLALAATFTTSAIPPATITPQNITGQMGEQGIINRLYWPWTSDSNGDASILCDTYLPGLPYRLVTIPSTPSAPTDNYDVYLYDTIRIESGLVGSTGPVVLSTELLVTQGMNRDTVNPEYVDLITTLSIMERPVLVVDAAGDTKSGVVILYVYTPGTDDIDLDS